MLLLFDEEAGRAAGAGAEAALELEAGAGEGVLAITEVMRTMEVWPLAFEAVEERVMVAVEGGGAAARRVVAGFGGLEGREMDGRAGLAGWLAVEDFSFPSVSFSFSLSPLLLLPLPELPLLLPLLPLLLLEPVASAAPPREAIVAVGLPCERTKKGVSSFRLQHTFDASRFWSQQYWPPWLEHCCTA